jgi:Transposase DDE domain group 1
VRADFAGGALSSDFGALLLRGIDRQIGFTERLAAAVRDKRHPSYIDHTLRALFAQRIYQMASGYADGNDANRLRYDPMFTLRIERVPLDPTQDLASAPPCSRLEHRVTRTDRYRLPHAFVDHCMASSPEPPAAIVLDLDHSEDPTHGQQELPCYHHPYQRYGSLPLWIFAGPSHALVTACLRPGKRPPGMENAMILVWLLSYLRRQAAPGMQAARDRFRQQTAHALAYGEPPPSSSRVYEDFMDAAASWAQPWRGIVKAEVMAAGDNARFVVTSLEAPTPQHVYEDRSCARGNCENDIKAVKWDLHSDRTSATICLANAARRLLLGPSRGPRPHQCGPPPWGAVNRRWGGLRDARRRHRAAAEGRAPALAPGLKGSRRDWPGLFHGSAVPDVPRTNKDLEQCLGAQRSPERRTTGRTSASPARGRRGAVPRLAATATRRRALAPWERAPEDGRAWQALRHALAPRRQRRTLRRRFRRHPPSYVAERETAFLKLTLPP